MDIRIGTFNIYWFPGQKFIGNTRDPADLKKIRRVIVTLDADILVFQEIVDLAALESVLSGVLPHRSYRLRDQKHRWLSDEREASSDQKVVVGYDHKAIDLVESGVARRPSDAPPKHGLREPFAVRLREKASSRVFTVVGVHLKSGIPTSADPIREAEMSHLGDWIVKRQPVFPDGSERPVGEPMILIGDFNAVRGNPDLKPLTAGGALAAWQWPAPKFAVRLGGTPTAVPPTEVGEWTTHLDRAIIDHVMLSAEAHVVDGPWVYAFDRDADFRQAEALSADWMEQKTYKLTPPGSTNKPLIENLHRISDHRPVRVTVTF